jgi:hypothetical protein
VWPAVKKRRCDTGKALFTVLKNISGNDENGPSNELEKTITLTKFHEGSPNLKLFSYGMGGNSDIFACRD